MNFNLTNILGTIAAVVAFATQLSTDILGCSVDAAGVTVCSASWLPPQMAAYAVMFFSGLLLVSKVIRPGGPLRGLFGSTAVVVPSSSPASGPGTVTPGQVASH